LLLQLCAPPVKGVPAAQALDVLPPVAAPPVAAPPVPTIPPLPTLPPVATTPPVLAIPPVLPLPPVLLIPPVPTTGASGWTLASGVDVQAPGLDPQQGCPGPPPQTVPVIPP